jgi:hypothetical protein
MRRINVGDVIAVAVDGVRNPPVGQVIECDDDAITLAAFQWLNGYFGGAQILVRRRDIRATLWAERMASDDLTASGFYRDGETVYDMTPLADFQTYWQVK